MFTRSRIALSVATAALVLATSACGGDDDKPAGGEAAGSGAISLVGYSTIQEVYKELISAYQATGDGKGVTFKESFGASGAQSRAIVAGQPADLVHLSLEPDVKRLVEAGLVDANWKSTTHKGIGNNSVVSFVVRKGNPKGIKTWDDLIKPGVEVLTANPLTSGGARWNVIAGYGAQIKAGKTEAEGEAYLKELFTHITVQDKSAREALNTFNSGKGDVLLSYENEAIAAQLAGQELDYVVPDSTLLIETPIAILKDSKNKAATEKFLAFIYSDAAQEIWAKHGYRPLVESKLDKAKFPKPSGQFTIDDVGGWDALHKRFFDEKEGVVAKIQGASAG